MSFSDLIEELLDAREQLQYESIHLPPSRERIREIQIRKCLACDAINEFIEARLKEKESER